MKKKHSVSGKLFAGMLALALVIGGAVGGTVAWLTDTTEEVKNTFTVGDINIKLEESKYVPETNRLTTETTKVNNNYKIVPGVDLPKDPTVTVVAGSEDCWLFVKVNEENWPNFKETDNTLKVKYGLADDWQQGDGTNIPANVYYRPVDANEADQNFQVLAGGTGKNTTGQITVADTLTKTEIEGMKNNPPKLTFTAYAVQKAGFVGNPAGAWDAVYQVTPQPSPATTVEP